MPTKRIRVPRTHAGGAWTRGRFWCFLRSGFRLMSRRWPPRRNALTAARRPYTGPNKRQKWEYQCSLCSEWFNAKQVAVDHINAAGSLRSWEDVRGFLERLFCEQEELRVICDKCHDERHQQGHPQ